MDSHLQPFVSNQSDKELFFESNEIESSVSNYNLCNSDHLQEDELLNINEICQQEHLECFLSIITNTPIFAKQVIIILKQM